MGLISIRYKTKELNEKRVDNICSCSIGKKIRKSNKE